MDGLLRDNDEAWATMVRHLMGRGLKIHDASIAASYFIEFLKVVEKDLKKHGMEFA